MTFKKVPQSVVDTVRILSIDAIQQANSGHPGTPMGAAEMTLVLWSHHLRFNPEKPDWQDRDRFVLSAGHASSLLYSMMHLFGYDLTLDEIKKFRQLGSRTAGHPEYWEIPGIEMTTGPLGQGVASAVGMALGQALIAGNYNTEKHQIANGSVYCLAGDGCMMEGITAEAASLAGHLGLGNLTLIYDKNDVTIDGSTELTFTEDVAQRYEAYGWQVFKVSAYDQQAFSQAVEEGKKNLKQPTLIVAQSVIGRGCATLEGSAATHGAALGEEEVSKTRHKMGWPDERFYVPEEAREWCQQQVERKLEEYGQWKKTFAAWRKANVKLAEKWDQQWQQKADDSVYVDLVREMATTVAATRKHSGTALQKLACKMPWLIGGSADLTESNCAEIKGGAAITQNRHSMFFGSEYLFWRARTCNGCSRKRFESSRGMACLLCYFSSVC